MAHSIDTALANMQELITEAINANKFSIGIFLDLAKAFDSVYRGNLIKKVTNLYYKGLASAMGLKLLQ